MPCSTKLNSNKNAKSNLTLTPDNLDCYTLYSLSVFPLAKGVQLILEISATYRLVTYPLVDNRLICRLRAQCMISNNNINSCSL